MVCTLLTYSIRACPSPYSSCLHYFSLTYYLSSAYSSSSCFCSCSSLVLDALLMLPLPHRWFEDSAVTQSRLPITITIPSPLILYLPIACDGGCLHSALHHESPAAALRQL